MKIKNRVILSVGAVFLALLSGCSATGGMNGSDNWESVSGSFDGWRQIGDANWRLEGNTFVADAGNGHLVTEESFTDFEIRAEFWVDQPANSGVFLRASDPNEITQSNAYEVNIFDTRPDQTYRTGSIVEFAPPTVSVNTDGQWNVYSITADGNKIKVVLNGFTTVELEDDTYRSGPISLQYGAGVVKFRNVQIRRL